MSDTPAEAASRLEGPPNAGYSTSREKLASDFIVKECRMYERNRALLLLIVTEGLQEWRRKARPTYRAIGVTDDVIDRIYALLVQWAGPNPELQLHTLHGIMRIDELTTYDKRRSTRTALTEGLRAAMKDLKREQRRKH